MYTSTFSDTHNHDKFLNEQTRLSELAESGELTSGLLDESMKAMYDDGDYIDRSIGFAWLASNSELFNTTATRLGFKVGDFLIEHGGLCWVGSRVLLHSEVVALIPESEREAFVKEIYRRHGAFNNGWIGVVTTAGVPLSTVAELILTKLTAVADNCEDSNVVNAVWDFLANHGSTYPGDIHWSMLTDTRFSEVMGKLADREPASFLAQQVCIEGRLGKERYEELARLVEPRRHEPAPHFTMSWEPTQWAALSDAQFVQAMSICARKSPVHFFGKRSQIEERIGKDAFNALALEAVLRMDKLSADQQKFVAEQPLPFQLQVARKLNASAEFLIALMLKLNSTDGADLYREKSTVFDTAHIATLYRSTWALRHQDGKSLAPWLERELERRLTEAGYIVRTVTEGTFTPRGSSSPQRQLQVVDNGRTYVVERGQRDYYPKAGDVVIIHARSASSLTPRVFAATFLPAHNGEKVSF